MANEATIITLLGNGGDPIRYTMGNTGSLTKGAFAKITDAVIASGVSLVNAACAGICTSDKISGVTSASFYTNIIADCKASGVINAGDRIAMADDNYVKAFDDSPANSGASLIGYSLETAANAEVIACRIKL